METTEEGRTEEKVESERRCADGRRCGRGRSEPGTAVDVVQDANFWLVAHAALQGTARVPNYHILCNEPNADPGAAAPKLAMEEIVQVTYDLCHGHFKCNRSVSVPSPVYFADLAAERAVSLYEFNQGVRGKFLGGDFDEEQSLQSLRLFF